MITTAEPPSIQIRAYALSLALHLCALGLLAALFPLWHAASGYGSRDEAEACIAPCGRVFAIRIERRARAAATLGIRRLAETLLPPESHVQSIAAQRASQRTFSDSPKARNSQHEAATSTAQLVSTGAGGSNANISVSTAEDSASASRLQPNALSANPSSGTEPMTEARTQAQLGPANWGSHFDAPTLRDRELFDEIVAKLPKRGSITIAVDEQGRATDVRIDAPGLDPATVDDLRKRLLSAHYAPVERDGIAYDGTLTIKSSSLTR